MAQVSNDLQRYQNKIRHQCKQCVEHVGVYRWKLGSSPGVGDGGMNFLSDIYIFNIKYRKCNKHVVSKVLL